jgi:hypothetical protein
MIIYNVTIKVANAAAAEWMQWMQEEHMAEVVATGCFSAYKLFRLLEQDDSEGPTYCAQYTCERLEQYQRYIADYAPMLRDKGFARFGNQFIAFRSVMQQEA